MDDLNENKPIIDEKDQIIDSIQFYTNPVRFNPVLFKGFKMILDKISVIEDKISKIEAKINGSQQ